MLIRIAAGRHPTAGRHPAAVSHQTPGCLEAVGPNQAKANFANGISTSHPDLRRIDDQVST